MISKFASTGEIDLANTVNRAAKDSSLAKISVRHYDQCGALLHILTVLQKHACSVQEMENIVLAGREACVANISFSGEKWHGHETEISAEISAHELIIDVKH